MMISIQKRRPWWALSILLILVSIGCEKKEVELPPKAPRPVTVMTLKESSPIASYDVSGSVQSWKTEQMGFEVEGRLDWVLEPGRKSLIEQGAELAHIDPAKYEVAVGSAKAALDVAMADQKVIDIRITSTLPKDIESARADVKLAEIDFNRMVELKNQNAVAKSEYETAENQLKTQETRLANLLSSQEQAQAELAAAVANVTRAEQAYQDAKRDLKNTTLRAPYEGQISSVNVVPGSVVSNGSEVLTFQMMKPIKVEIEVSAEQSRQLQRRRQVPVSFKLPDGSGGIRKEKAIVYLIDPSADRSTRTFTVTLLVVNEQYRPKLAEELQGLPVARTQDAWPLKISEIIGGSNDMYLVEEEAIQHVDGSSYVWMMKDVRFGTTIPNLIKVERKEIIPGQFKFSFLGNWKFQQVTFVDKTVDRESLLAGKLEFIDIKPSEWDNESVVVDTGDQWMLRPGDLVNVTLDPDKGKPGLFAPVEAIYEDLGETYLFVVDGNLARKTKVQTISTDSLDTGSMIRIEPIDSSSLPPDVEIVVGGVHYLNDGDEINIVDRIDVDGGQE